jgi:hypothetical protein
VIPTAARIRKRKPGKLIALSPDIPAVMSVKDETTTVSRFGTQLAILQDSSYDTV